MKTPTQSPSTSVAPCAALPHGTKDARASVAVLWEGAAFAEHSLSIVNREVASRLLTRGVDLAFVRSETDTFSVAKDSRWARLATRCGAELERAADVHVRHFWPPDFSAPRGAKLALIQPWEYGSLPRAWIEPMNTRVDEVWVPTRFVQGAYAQSGVDPARVHVVPNGVNVERFHPGATPRARPSPRAFQFLFVGGALPRKGVHVLLEAWSRAFTSADNVALIIKDFGTRGVYRGQTLRDLVLQHAARKNSAEIVYQDDTLTEDEMPGLYTAADCLVHPYLGEGFGLPIAEAMACALPVVVTNGGAALDFCDETCAFLIPAREVRMNFARVGDLETVERPLVHEPDVDALAAILRRIVSDPTSARAKGVLARERIGGHFTWDHAADLYAERLRVLAHRAAPSSAQSRPSSRAALFAIPAERTSVSRPTKLDEEIREAHASNEPARVASLTPRTSIELPATHTDTLSLRFGSAPFNYSGYARLARMLLPALEADGIDVQLQAYAADRPFLNSLADRPAELQRWLSMLKRDVQSGVHVAFHPPVSWNGYGFFRNARAQNPSFDAHVGFTMFETDRLPSGWAAECATMDEVWVPSCFNMETFAAAGVPREKLRLFQPGIDLAPFRAATKPLAIPGQSGFTFLSVFQWTLRKGWDVLLSAYVNAFTRNDDVCLAIRAYPGHKRDPPIRARIDAYLRSIGRDPRDCPRIVVIDAFVREDDLPALYAAADAYVLPTRGEGFGLPFLEAMACGLPTIGTRFGGQLDFMDDACAYMIEIDGLEPVAPEMTAEDRYYEADHLWARPNVKSTADLMRRVFDDRDAARARGDAARRRVFAEWGTTHSATAFRKLASELVARAPSTPTPAARRACATPPVVWNGPLLDASGYADEGRDLALGLDAIGVRVRANPAVWSREFTPLDPREGHALARITSATLFERAVLIQHGLGDQLHGASAALKCVGRTMYETDRLPAGWATVLNALDEVWVPSEFNVETFERAGVERAKLVIVPGALDAERFEQLQKPLELDGARRFNFLGVLDWSLRKGWDVLLRAYIEAFRPSDNVALFLKTHSSRGLSPADVQGEIRRFVRDVLHRDPDRIPTIRIMTKNLARSEMLRLHLAADAYVLPSRGEGWGRPHMDAMACARPTIGTRWSGNLAFMSDETSYLVDAEIVDVPPEAVRENPLIAGHRWAEPSAAHLTEILRRVVRDQRQARKVGQLAQHDVLARFDRRRVAEVMRARIEALAERAKRA